MRKIKSSTNKIRNVFKWKRKRCMICALSGADIPLSIHPERINLSRWVLLKKI